MFVCNKSNGKVVLYPMLNTRAKSKGATVGYPIALPG